MKKIKHLFTPLIALSIIMLCFQNCNDFAPETHSDSSSTLEASPENNEVEPSPENPIIETPNFTNSEPNLLDTQVDSASIQWTTNQEAQTWVKYGDSADKLELETSKVQSFITTHQHDLINLKSETQYFFQTQSINDLGEITQSQVMSFTTPTEITAFKIVESTVNTATINDSSATISWEVNQPAQGYVKYGLSSTALNLETNKEVSFNFSKHNQDLKNLKTKTTYFFQTVSTNEKGITLTSDIASFTTTEADTAPPPSTSEGIYIKNSDWNAGRLLNAKFGDHSSDSGFVPSQTGDTDAIRVTLIKGSHYGSAAIFNFPQKTQEVWITYCMRFADNWTTSVGGKLPGFSGDSSPSNGGQGGAPSDGSNAWSARGIYGEFDSANKAIPLGNYVYHTDYGLAGQKYGDAEWWSPDGSFSKAKRAQHKRWYTIKQRIKMNTSGKNNGVIQGWVDGELSYTRDNYNFTNNENFREVKRFWLDIYHGGGATSPHDQHVYFDQINYFIGNTDKTSAKCEN